MDLFWIGIVVVLALVSLAFIAVCERPTERP
jgi:hypothetical protein